jgi:hypothetical protein
MGHGEGMQGGRRGSAQVIHARIYLLVLMLGWSDCSALGLVPGHHYSVKYLEARDSDVHRENFSEHNFELLTLPVNGTPTLRLQETVDGKVTNSVHTVYNQGWTFKRFIEDLATRHPTNKEADIVFVFDAPYKSKGHLTPGEKRDNLDRIYKTMALSPEYKHKNGTNFFIFLKDRLSPQLCPSNGPMGKASYLISEWGQRQCGRSSFPSDTLVIPYSTDLVSLDVSGPRKPVLFYAGSCRNDSSGGNDIVVHFEKVLRNEHDVAFYCACGICPNALATDVVVAHMLTSVFCFMSAKDISASRRLTDAIVHGCIPVFVGPPFHELPFDNYFDYSEFSMSFLLQSWPQYLSPEHRGSGHFHAPPNTVLIQNASSIMGHLRAVPMKRIQEMQATLALVRSYFMFEPRLPGKPCAFDLILHHLCTLQGIRT